MTAPVEPMTMTAAQEASDRAGADKWTTHHRGALGRAHREIDALRATVAAQAKVIDAAITLRHCPPFRREMAASAFDAARAALGATK